MHASILMDVVHCQQGMFVRDSFMRLPMIWRIRVMGMTSYSFSAAGAAAGAVSAAAGAAGT